MSSSRKSAPAREPLDINRDCKEYMIDYLKTAFPTRMLRVLRGADGWRITDGAGNSVLGRIVSPAGFEKGARAFGITMSIAPSPAELIAAARADDGVALPAPGQARLKRSRVNGDARLEIADFPPERRDALKALGCFTEIIAYKTRLFVPIHRAEAILARIAPAGPNQLAA